MNKNFILFFIVLLLLIIKLVSIKITNFNLFGDEAQYWLWSKELDFGYFQNSHCLKCAVMLPSRYLHSKSN